MLSHEMAGDLQAHRREYEAAVARLMEENAQLKAELTHRNTQLHSAVSRIKGLKVAPPRYPPHLQP